MRTSSEIFLSKTPFIRLLIPFCLGIIVQWYWQPTIQLGMSLYFGSLLTLVLFFVTQGFFQFKYEAIRGCILVGYLFSAGCIVTCFKDPSHQPNWFGSRYQQDQLMILLNEAPVENANSYKAEALVKYIYKKKSWQRASGKIIVYFKKDTAVKSLKALTTLVINKPLQEIRNTNNPGGFDYKRYALFNGITHQVYLSGGEYKIKPVGQQASVQSLLLSVSDYVLNVIRTYIPGKREQGLAEALLIGYRGDLDKDLLQSYSKTGVVHIIAVSGMHLGLIYLVLNALLKPVLWNRKLRWLHPVMILIALWIFAFVAGGAASVVRAAFMFTLIEMGKLMYRNASLYNVLAASAFCLLAYNPYWLWDVGFQLSYAAVLSIGIFYKPVYSFFYIENRLLKACWQLMAVSIAAQILTTPVAIYYFHQFPVYFLITNLAAVPVSSFILIGELVLVLIAPFNTFAALIGKILHGLIWWMNTFIENLGALPFASWQGLKINFVQLVLLFVIIAGFSYGFWKKRKPFMWLSLVAILCFMIIRAIDFYRSERQKKLIVYNISKMTAVHFINGRKQYLLSDSSFAQDAARMQNALRPAAVLYRLKNSATPVMANANLSGFLFGNKKIIVLNKAVDTTMHPHQIQADILILCGNPPLYMKNVCSKISASIVVIASSVPFWKAAYWKKDCADMGISVYNVAEKGAFVINAD